MCVFVNRHKVTCASLMLASNSIRYVDCMKYLGIYVKCGKRFACSYDHVILSFYRAVRYLIFIHWLSLVVVIRPHRPLVFNRVNIAITSYEDSINVRPC
jgi:hypothetical protein